jgi:lipopolysaccharide transport system permease protein
MNRSSAQIRTANTLSVPAPLTGLWLHRHLITQLIRRDVMGRYRGSFLGVFWSLFNPLLSLAVYTFAFGVVFRTKWVGSQTGGLLEFAVMLFAGLIVFTVFSECVTRAPGVVLSNPNFVKKIVFPLELLPVMLLGSALFHATASFAVLLVGVVFTYPSRCSASAWRGFWLL